MIAWLRKLFGLGSHPHLVLEVGEDLLRTFQRVAHREGMTVEVWARRVLTNAVPQKELRQLNLSALRSAGMEAVFDKLDQDEAAMPNLVTFSPVLRPARALPMVPGHPCSFLRAEYPEGFSSKDCQGSCGSPKQEGRICHWASAVAMQCPEFEPKRAPRNAG